MEPHFLWEKKGKRYFQLPPRWQVVRDLAPECEEPTRSLDQMLEESLSHPIGTPPLRELVGPKDRILLLVDDLTRSTPKKEILAFLLRHLEAAGIRHDQMRILFALGTHRPLSESEVEEALGKEIRASPFRNMTPARRGLSRSEGSKQALRSRSTLPFWRPIFESVSVPSSLTLSQASEAGPRSSCPAWPISIPFGSTTWPT